MYGGSYPGATQIAAAISGHPALSCIAPALIGAHPYHASYWGGAFRLYWQTGWGLKPPEGMSREVINNYLPLLETDIFVRGQQVPYWQAGCVSQRPTG